MLSRAELRRCERRLPSGQHEAAEDHECNADTKTRVFGVVLDGRCECSAHDTNNDEHRNETGRSCGAYQEGALNTGALAARLRALETQEVHEVGGQHHEAAWVYSGKNAEEEAVGKVALQSDHGARSISLMTERMVASLKAMPFCAVMVPSAATNNV